MEARRLTTAAPAVYVPIPFVPPWLQWPITLPVLPVPEPPKPGGKS